jgi:hypothetical protein
MPLAAPVTAATLPCKFMMSVSNGFVSHLARLTFAPGPKQIFLGGDHDLERSTSQIGISVLFTE